jgi:hypothetical protein
MNREYSIQYTAYAFHIVLLGRLKLRRREKQEMLQNVDYKISPEETCSEANWKKMLNIFREKGCEDML